MNKVNHRLGTFNLDEIPPMQRGQPQIEVTFDINANSILNVTAVEKSIGKNNKIVITNDKGRLSKDDIDRLVKDEEKFKDEDNKVKERVKAKNSLEQYEYQIRQTIKDEKLKDKFSEEEKKQIETKVDEVLKWVNDNPAASKEEYDAKQKEIEAIFNLIIQKIYQQMGGQQGGMPNFGGANPSGTSGSGPNPGTKGTAIGGDEDVE